MKGKILLISLILTSVCGYSQTAIFNYSRNTVSCKIVKSDERTIESKNSVLDYCGEIRKIQFHENPILPSEKSHYFAIGSQKLLFEGTANNDVIWGKETNSKDLKQPTTLQPGDCISLYRGTYDKEGLVGNIVISFPIGYIEKKIKITSFDTNDFTLNQDLKQFKFKVQNNSNCIIYDYKLVYLGKEEDISIDNDNCFTISMNPSKLSSDNKQFPIAITYKIKNHEYYAVQPTEIASITLETKPISDGPGWKECLIYGLILVIFITAACFLCQKLFGFSKFNFEIQTYDGKILKCSSKSENPSIGDIVNKEGTFATSNGIVYQCKKDKKNKIRISSVLTRISCKNEEYFDIGPINNSNTPGYLVPNCNGEDIKLSLGMYTLQNGEYVTENNYVVNILNKKIVSILYRIYYKSKSNQIDVQIRHLTPQVGDTIVVKTGTTGKFQFEATDGNIYEIANNKIIKITPSASTYNSNATPTPVPTTPASDNQLAKLEEDLRLAEQANLQLKERLNGTYTKEEYETLKGNYDTEKRKLQELEKKHKELQKSISQEKQQLKEAEEKIQKTIQEAMDTGKAEGKFETERQYKKLISEQYISLSKHDELVKPLKTQKEDAVKAKERADEKIKAKDEKICDAEAKIVSLKRNVQLANEALIKQTAANANLKDAAKKKNMHYVLQVQETLSEISETFKDVYKDISNQQIKEGLIAPMLRGVSGLSTGILSWAEDFTVKVLEESEGFFGADFLAMQESDVKELLAKKFISNVIKSDSFSKFIRLYQLSTVPFIRKQLIEAQLNVVVLNKLYYKVYSLVTDFGYTIICPNLFEEKYTEAKYQWFNSTNLFGIIELPDDVKDLVKGSEIIIDINQIGFNSIWANRKATAVTPDF